MSEEQLKQEAAKIRQACERNPVIYEQIALVIYSGGELIELEELEEMINGESNDKTK